ncbi:UV DNA damage repair endonuclease UvsE [Methanoculleus sp. Wushi-C6]|uniref:UV DNA damage repair endonuclease UvsE n=1 Tax=Methanoculleus caldifontis TaxID=2651577 RepID=A0ABU3X431_9EURY|nr:UV DNA damage repair endonuclease UvsE [Methanoculleus sp. Wushi-C6]MDV2482815.1 UV DNA damage repair endonuclease UvsE [Methanoculleus sp. Wushi-C6]
MKIGYPCINRSVGCSSGRTFRLASYSDERLIATVRENLRCLDTILRFNLASDLLFFRITSDLVPFGSHPIAAAPWEETFAEEFAALGRFIDDHGMRISMHPDQFVVINAKDPDIIGRSVAELRYHARVLDALHLDRTAKIQIHVGGVYGDKEAAMERFCREYSHLDESILRRLVVENDDSRYTLADCLRIHEETGIPVLFDAFHHHLNSSGEGVAEAVREAATTWEPHDGILMTDYSTAMPGGRRGRHAESLDPADFAEFLNLTAPTDMDIMLEIKDKEKSALLAVGIARRDGRFRLQQEH